MNQWKSPPPLPLSPFLPRIVFSPHNDVKLISISALPSETVGKLYQFDLPLPASPHGETSLNTPLTVSPHRSIPYLPISVTAPCSVCRGQEDTRPNNSTYSEDLRHSSRTTETASHTYVRRVSLLGGTMGFRSAITPFKASLLPHNTLASSKNFPAPSG